MPEGGSASRSVKVIEVQPDSKVMHTITIRVVNDPGSAFISYLPQDFFIYFQGKCPAPKREKQVCHPSVTSFVTSLQNAELASRGILTR
jgi:hypothetical protein